MSNWMKKNWCQIKIENEIRKFMKLFLKTKFGTKKIKKSYQFIKLVMKKV